MKEWGVLEIQQAKSHVTRKCRCNYELNMWLLSRVNPAQKNTGLLEPQSCGRETETKLSVT